VSSLNATSASVATVDPVHTPSVVSGSKSPTPGTAQKWNVLVLGATHVYQTDTPPRSDVPVVAVGMPLASGSPVSIVASTVVPAIDPLAPLIVVPGKVSFPGGAAAASVTRVSAVPPAAATANTLRSTKWLLIP
jgi:hypothetical protein